MICGRSRVKQSSHGFYIIFKTIFSLSKLRFSHKNLKYLKDATFYAIKLLNSKRVSKKYFVLSANHQHFKDGCSKDENKFLLILL